MAKGTDSDEFVLLSRVRTGLKREFVFAMKAQSEIGGSLGRTRASKNRNDAPVQTAPASKRSRKSGSLDADVADVDVGGDAMSEEEAKSDVVNLASDDEPKNNQVAESESESVVAVPLCKEEPKSDVVLETVIDEVEVEPLKVKEEKEEVMDEEIAQQQQQPLCENKEDLEKGEEKATAFVAPVKEEEEDVKEEKKVVPLEKKPMRRFTRSALKIKSEETNDGDNASGIAVGVVDDKGVPKRETEASPLMTLPTPTPMKTSRSSSKRFPSKLKDLLATGILEGLPVKYLRGRLKVLFDFSYLSLN